MFLNKRDEITIKTGGNLPHWHQDGKIQYITFRLADSLPQNVLQRLHHQISIFKSAHPEPWDEATKRQYWNLVGPAEERMLDNGYGSCILREAKAREILSNALEFKNDIEYRIIAYVIMPNHVHLLIQPFGENTIERILHSVKSYSSRQINVMLGRTGPLWMKESFDRLVRNEDELKHYISYIRSNPKHLPSTHYTLKY